LITLAPGGIFFVWVAAWPWLPALARLEFFLLLVPSLNIRSDDLIVRAYLLLAIAAFPRGDHEKTKVDRNENGPEGSTVTGCAFSWALKKRESCRYQW